MENEQRRMDWNKSRQIKSAAQVEAWELVSKARAGGDEAVSTLKLRTRKSYEAAWDEWNRPSLFDLTVKGFIKEILG